MKINKITGYVRHFYEYIGSININNISKDLAISLDSYMVNSVRDIIVFGVDILGKKYYISYYWI